MKGAKVRTADNKLDQALKDLMRVRAAEREHLRLSPYQRGYLSGCVDIVMWLTGRERPPLEILLRKDEQETLRRLGILEPEGEGG